MIRLKHVTGAAFAFLVVLPVIYVRVKMEMKGVEPSSFSVQVRRSPG